MLMKSILASITEIKLTHYDERKIEIFKFKIPILLLINIRLNRIILEDYYLKL